MVSESVRPMFHLQNNYSINYLLQIKVSKYNKRHLKIEKMNTFCCWDNLPMINFYSKCETCKQLSSNEPS